MAKILHTGDNHLGFVAYSKTGDDGINIRQQDMFSSFEKMVDTAISERVECILICGDLFHNIKNSNTTIGFCINQLDRLRKQDIDVYIIGGNHDTPKTTGASSPLVIVEFLDNVVCAYDDYRFYESPDFNIHMIPYQFTKDNLKECISKAKKNTESDRFDIIMLHVGTDTFKMLQYDEVLLSKSEVDDLKASFDYVALGHYHGEWIDENVAYCGSLEKLTFNEKDDRKGFIILNDASKSVDFIENKDVRTMIELDDVDISKSMEPTDDILNAIKKENIDGCICRMKVVGVSALVYRSLDFRNLRKATEDALHFDFIFDIREEELDFNTDKASFKTMLEEWKEYTTERGINDDIVVLGANYIKIEEV